MWGRESAPGGWRSVGFLEKSGNPPFFHDPPWRMSDEVKDGKTGSLPQEAA